MDAFPFLSSGTRRHVARFQNCDEVEGIFPGSCQFLGAYRALAEASFLQGSPPVGMVYDELDGVVCRAWLVFFALVDDTSGVLTPCPEEVVTLVVDAFRYRPNNPSSSVWLRHAGPSSSSLSTLLYYRFGASSIGRQVSWQAVPVPELLGT